MRSHTLLMVFLFLSFSGINISTQGQNTFIKNTPVNLEAAFNEFFSLSDGDSADIERKLQLSLQICKEDGASKYCSYVVAWGKILEKDFEEALKIVQKLERESPEWAEVYFLHALYFSYKKESGYIEQAQKCIELNPKLAQPYFFLALQYQDMQNFKLALTYYDFLEKADPKHRSVYYNRGYVKAALKDNQGAVADYTRALALDPLNIRALFNRGHAYLLLADYANGEADFDAFIKARPVYPPAYYYRGAAKYYLGNKTAACEDMQTAAKLGYPEASTFISSYCN